MCLLFYRPNLLCAPGVHFLFAYRLQMIMTFVDFVLSTLQLLVDFVIDATVYVVVDHIYTKRAMHMCRLVTFHCSHQLSIRLQGSRKRTE